MEKEDKVPKPKKGTKCSQAEDPDSPLLNHTSSCGEDLTAAGQKKYMCF